MKITVVTITFNAAGFLERTLQSVLDQTTAPYEHLFIDGASSDETLSILERYCQDHAYAKLLSEKDNGIYDAMNKGIQKASGSFILFLNAGDVFANKKVLAVYTRVLGLGKAKVIGSNINYVSEDGGISREWRMKNYPGNFAGGWHLAHPGFLASKDLLQSIGGFNLKYRVAADFDLMLRAIKRIEKEELVLIPDVTVHMLEGGFSNGSLKNILRGNAEVRESIRTSGESVNVLYTVRRLLTKIIDKLR